MINNLLIYKFSTLFQILLEHESQLNFKIHHIENKEILLSKASKLKNYIVLSKTEIPEINNILIYDFVPMKFSQLIEKINLQFLKRIFLNQRSFKVGGYFLDINSRQISLNNNKLKLTEKELNTIIYLSKKILPINVEELEKNVWNYQEGMETHTVETHIYRLRKKIFDKFKDKDFLVRKKTGYLIKK
jgi:hypothetical protein